MSWNLISQCVNLAVSTALLIRFVRLGFQRIYVVIFLYIAFEALQSFQLIVFRWCNQPFDYRFLYCPSTVLAWLITIWMVRSILTSILKSLPGILRFSTRFLNGVFLLWIFISLATFFSGYAAYKVMHPGLLPRLTAALQVLDGRFLLALVLVVLSVLIFVLRFPIQVRRNLAVFGAGVCVPLLAESAVTLIFNFVPELRRLQVTNGLVASLPTFVMVATFSYWLFAVNAAGEEVRATLGREWQSVPKEHLVRQLEAMNAALLRSREQT